MVFVVHPVFFGWEDLAGGEGEGERQTRTNKMSIISLKPCGPMRPRRLQQPSCYSNANKHKPSETSARASHAEHMLRSVHVCMPPDAANTHSMQRTLVPQPIQEKQKVQDRRWRGLSPTHVSVRSSTIFFFTSVFGKTAQIREHRRVQTQAEEGSERWRDGGLWRSHPGASSTFSMHLAASVRAELTVPTVSVSVARVSFSLRGGACLACSFTGLFRSGGTVSVSGGSSSSSSSATCRFGRGGRRGALLLFSLNVSRSRLTRPDEAFSVAPLCVRQRRQRRKENNRTEGDI